MTQCHPKVGIRENAGILFKAYEGPTQLGLVEHPIVKAIVNAEEERVNCDGKKYEERR
jgi:hypothetical protein